MERPAAMVSLDERGCTGSYQARVVHGLTQGVHAGLLIEANRHRAAGGRVIDVDEHRFGRQTVEEVDQGLLQIGEGGRARRVSLATSEHRVERPTGVRPELPDEVALGRQSRVEHHAADASGLAAQDLEGDPSAVRDAVEVPLVVAEGGAQQGEVGSDLGVAVGAELDAVAHEALPALGNGVALQATGFGIVSVEAEPRGLDVVDLDTVERRS